MSILLFICETLHTHRNSNQIPKNFTLQQLHCKSAPVLLLYWATALMNMLINKTQISLLGKKKKNTCRKTCAADLPGYLQIIQKVTEDKVYDYSCTPVSQLIHRSNRVFNDFPTDKLSWLIMASHFLHH